LWQNGDWGFRKTWLGPNKSGWWHTNPFEKYEFVSWDDEIPKIWKNVTNHQPVKITGPHENLLDGKTHMAFG
jgi:hypothetical protein